MNVWIPSPSLFFLYENSTSVCWTTLCLYLSGQPESTSTEWSPSMIRTGIKQIYLSTMSHYLIIFNETNLMVKSHKRTTFVSWWRKKTPRIYVKQHCVENNNIGNTNQEDGKRMWHFCWKHLPRGKFPVFPLSAVTSNLYLKDKVCCNPIPVDSIYGKTLITNGLKYFLSSYCMYTPSVCNMEGL